MLMDRSWMQLNRSDPSFGEGVEEFIRFAYSRKAPHEKIPCPCYDCNNFCDQTQEVVRYHLSINGIKRSYIRWVYHGEAYEDDLTNEGNIEENVESDDSDDDCNVDEIREMLNDISNAYLGQNLDIEETVTTLGAPFPLGRADTFLKLLKDSEDKLYKGCEPYSKLSFLIKMLHIKTISGWTNKSFDMLLELLKDAFGGVDVDIPKLQRLFVNKDLAQNMRWHKEDRVQEKNAVRHPANSEAWRDFDEKYPLFADDPRNVRKLGVFKRYVHNKARPEASIAELYIDNECLTFCSMYLHIVETRFNRVERNYDIGEQLGNMSVFACKGRPFGAPTYKELSDADWKAIHLFVLKNCEEIEEYRSEHMLQLKAESEPSVDQCHDVHFPSWFRNRVEQLRAERLATDELVSLANGPDTRVKYYNGCNVNGFRFHTKDREINKKTQNSGVVVDGEHNQKIIEFYGIITDIIEMGGPGRRVDLHHSSLRTSSIDLHSHESQISRTIDNVDVDEEIVVNSTNTSSGKKKRGRTRHVALSRRKNANEKLTVDIPEKVNRIVGVNSQYAITESGCLARRFAPLQVTKWGRIEEDRKLDLLRDFRVRFMYRLTLANRTFTHLGMDLLQQTSKTQTMNLIRNQSYDNYSKRCLGATLDPIFFVRKEVARKRYEPLSICRG
ncbi:hypothetical protein BUALT_Bualt18G0026900 [Buddleja alternifolia]|uniref:Transposase n=1 Tax=Buddleja alternifolia TaxID=168488 RepID=A0AAV6WCJ7_9LAMI|nr:hypothetical protein BUALT_Bualt18G0026900 [Buddleja alternifolia]